MTVPTEFLSHVGRGAALLQIHFRRSVGLPMGHGLYLPDSRGREKAYMSFVQMALARGSFMAPREAGIPSSPPMEVNWLSPATTSRLVRRRLGWRTRTGGTRFD